AIAAIFVQTLIIATISALGVSILMAMG
ncbi:MAG: hypothetical protein RLZZ157_237, partial [Pseudomonadota bacterium]